MKVTVIPMVISLLCTVTKKIDKGTGGLGNKSMSGDHPNYSIVKISQNTKESPENSMGIAATQTPVMWKTLEWLKYYNYYYYYYY